MHFFKGGYLISVLKKRKLITNISGLQSFQLLKFLVFFIISVALTKFHYTSAEIGEWEMFLFVASLVTFFWVTGIIQSLLPLYNRNHTFNKNGGNTNEKSPEIFNAFLLLCLFSLAIFAIGHIFNIRLSIFDQAENRKFFNLLLIYVVLSSPVCLIEYIYLLKNRSYRILQYSIYTFSAQLIFIMVPLIMKADIVYAIHGLLAICVVRWIWLIVLLKKYAKFEFSYDFMKEHMYIAMPLIITTLISGSAQYIDGVITNGYYKDPATFAWFRYGAKEFPLSLMLATGLSNAMLPEFATVEKMKVSLEKIKEESKKIMHILFPLTMVVMFFTRWGYPRLFSPEFHMSTGVFMVYLLLTIPRLVFPHTILIGRKKTRVTLVAAILEFALNIPLSLKMLDWGYGYVGVAVATLIVYIVSKAFLVVYLWLKMGIKPAEYIPIKVYLMYSALLTLLFVLIDHRIIDFS